jgi:DNA-binding ferritin-like protein
MDPVGEFLLTMLHGVTNTHLLHWQEKNGFKHRVLSKFYELLSELTDDLAESIMGGYNTMPQFPVDYFHPAATGEEEVMALKQYVEENRKNLPQDTAIQTLVDAIQTQIDRTLYLIRKD